MALKPRDDAPDFDLPSTKGESMSLSDLLSDGEYAVLAFYPKARTSTCTEELTMLDEFQDDISALGGSVVGISCDATDTLEQWVEETGFTIPLLSDADPKGEVSEAYDVMSDRDVSERAYIIVDGNRTVRYSYVSPMGENPGVDRLFEALEAIEEEG